MNLYCVHLIADHQNTGEPTRLVINDVPAAHEDEARNAAIQRLLEVSPATTGVHFIRANRTDDAFWGRA